LPGSVRMGASAVLSSCSVCTFKCHRRDRDARAESSAAGGGPAVLFHARVEVHYFLAVGITADMVLEHHLNLEESTLRFYTLYGARSVPSCW